MRRTTLRRAVAAAAAPTLLVAALTACGSDSGGDALRRTARGHVQPSGDDQRPARRSTTTSSSMTSRPARGRHHGHVTMERRTRVDGEPIKAEGQVDYTTDPVSMAMTMNMAAMAGRRWTCGSSTASCT